MPDTLSERARRVVSQAHGRVHPAGWWLDGLLVAAFAALTAALAAGWFLDIDASLSNWIKHHQPAVLYWAAYGLNFLGNGGPLTGLCALIALWLCVRRRSIWPLAPVVAAFLLTGFTIMPLKLWTDRAAPNSKLPDRVELFNTLPPGEYSTSYPSGHLVNTMVWYGVLALLLAPWLSRTARRWLRIAPPAIVFCTTVYLNWHWLTDSIAGLFLGIVLARLLARIPWPALPPPEPDPAGSPAGSATPA